MHRLSVIKLLNLICIFPPIASGDNFPWLLQLTTSPRQEDVFKGSVFLSFVNFTDGSSEEQMFDVVLKPSDQLSKVLSLSRKYLTTTKTRLLFASYSCRTEPPARVILSSFSLTSGSTGLRYDSADVETPIKTEHALGACANAQVFQDFTVFDRIVTGPSPLCYAEGKFLKENETIDIGCRNTCVCKNGQLNCRSTCGQSKINGQQSCRLLNSLGSCCPKLDCLRNDTADTDDAKGSIIKCQSPKFDEAVDFTVPTWVYFIVTDRYSENKGSWCGATLVGEKWLLTPAHCVYTIQGSTKKLIISPPEFIEVYKPSASSGKVHLIGEVPSERITSVRVHPKYDPSLLDSARFDMALLELAAPVRITESIQYVNLPWFNRCFAYLDNVQCPIVSIAYANDTTTLSFDLIFGANFNPLEGGGVGPIGGECGGGGGGSGAVLTGNNFFCYQKTARPGRLVLGGVDGSGAVVKRNGFYELVGMALSSDRTWHKPGTPGASEINILALCDSLNWLNQTISDSTGSGN